MTSPTAAVQDAILVYHATLSEREGDRMFPLPDISLDALLRTAGMEVGSEVEITVSGEGGKRPVNFDGGISEVVYKPGRPLEVGFNGFPAKALTDAGYVPGEAVIVSLARKQQQ